MYRRLRCIMRQWVHGFRLHRMFTVYYANGRRWYGCGECDALLDNVWDPYDA